MRHLAPLYLVASLAIFAGSSFAEEKHDSVGIGPATYEFPASWERQRPSNQMRAVQYGVPLEKGDKGKIDFVVFYFGGGGGSVKANLDRWVGQFDEKDGKEKVETFEVDGMKVTTLDVTGTFKDKPAPFAPSFKLRKDWRMLAAVIETSDGPYFFRMVGPKASITAQLENWKHLLKSAKKKS